MALLVHKAEMSNNGGEQCLSCKMNPGHFIFCKEENAIRHKNSNKKPILLKAIVQIYPQMSFRIAIWYYIE